MQSAFATLGLPVGTPQPEVRRAWARLALETHPDRGGDPAKFREVHAAFETIRGNKPAVRPSWQDLAAEEDAGVPSYCVTIAKSGRGKCSKTGEFIPEGAVKCGSWIKELGDYGRWCSLEAWTVPFCVWAHVPAGDSDCQEEVERVLTTLSALEDVCLAGTSVLSPDQRTQMAKHLLGAKRAKRTAQPDQPKLPTLESDGVNGSTGSTGSTGTVLVKRKGPDLPTVEGRPFTGKIFVLTGVFGDGSGLAAGKPQLKAWLEGLGGKVTGSISKRTSFLVVGATPGAAKVHQAEGLGVAVSTVESVVEAAVAGDVSKAVVEDLVVERFSAGFHGDKRARLA